MNFASLMKYNRPMRFMLPASVAACALLATACDEETSKIGSSLTEGDVKISIDTLYFNLGASAIENNNYDARTGNLLFGNIDVPEYGKLNCSFVSRMMCSTDLNLPDSLADPARVDSCRLYLTIYRGDLTGDSLTPQKVSVYQLNRQLPSGITNAFDPTGYYDPSECLGSMSFTSSYAGRPDSIATSKPEAGSNNIIANSNISIPIKLPKEFGVKLFEDYKNNPEIFQWPSTFAEYFPGFYVKSTFGKGCVSNIYGLDLYVYLWYNEKNVTTENGDTTAVTWEHKPLYVVPMISSPEVLSSNNIEYKVSDYIKNLVAQGKSVITTPGGYNVELKFPAADIIRHYNKDDHNLSIISDLTLSVPAEGIDNKYGIATAPTLMLIKTSELKNFFNNNKIPDNKSSFTATYDSVNKCYKFSSMRSYIIDLIEKGTVTEDDVNFTIVPISLTTENSGYNNTTVYITKCTPYTIKPTMTLLDTEKAMIVFTFSSQIIE